MSNRVSKHKSRRFRRFVRANEAVSALEYAILVGVVAVAVGAALVTFGDKVTKAIGNISTNVEGGWECHVERHSDHTRTVLGGLDGRGASPLRCLPGGEAACSP